LLRHVVGLLLQTIQPTTCCSSFILLLLLLLLLLNACLLQYRGAGPLPLLLLVLPRQQLFGTLPLLLLLLLLWLLYAPACTAGSVCSFTPWQVTVQQPHAAPHFAATISSIQRQQLLHATT
jgi:hypothetical protein